MAWNEELWGFSEAQAREYVAKAAVFMHRQNIHKIKTAQRVIENLFKLTDNGRITVIFKTDRGEDVLDAARIEAFRHVKIGLKVLEKGGSKTIDFRSFGLTV